MAKYEKSLQGNFDQLLDWLHKDITGRSVSASFEEGSDYTLDGARVAVRVYERYSMTGKNRVSLNITLLGRGGDLFLSAITAGGSQAVFFKINIFGEEAFLDLCRQSVEKYIRHNNKGI